MVNCQADHPGAGIFRPVCDTLQNGGDSFRDISYAYDENGTFIGSGVVTVNVHLTSANSFTYSARIQFFDPDGNLLFSGCGRATGTRFE